MVESADTLKRSKEEKAVLNAYGLNKRDVYEAFEKYKIDCMFAKVYKVTNATLIMNVLYLYSSL